MQELSMNILDVGQNSVAAGATLLEIMLCQDTGANCQTLVIKDNGCGMPAELAAKAADPFATTRTTRRVGLGLPLLKMAAEQTGGGLQLQSEPGRGTTVTATFGLCHIDLAPLGDMGGTVAALAQAAPEMDLVFTFARNSHAFVFDTRKAREVLGEVPLFEPAAAGIIRRHVAFGVNEVLAAKPGRKAPTGTNG